MLQPVMSQRAISRDLCWEETPEKPYMYVAVLRVSSGALSVLEDDVGENNRIRTWTVNVSSQFEKQIKV